LAISKKYGCAEGTIRRRAKIGHWERDPEGVKRTLVKTSLATTIEVKPETTHETTHETTNSKATNENVETAPIIRNATIEEAAQQDIADMNLALSNARRGLKIVNILLKETPDDYRDAKGLLEANKVGYESIRRLRGLDEVKTGVSFDEEILGIGEDIALD